MNPFLNNKGKGKVIHIL